ncbi:hypothetical protein LOTGIDRAFT_152450 [Lottia gigantea]|uniref:Uncharacterized protein n=1 Tax=Lottia gigantea TaxID=225164 RepID=V4B528_LOTGI|nr:hypothetical protein LOTGIDRAFT_152450 [Lottia gigantea]ESP05593.1 hypothetical protein LOTGIDRAFT_152450 [Lottia gigantea]
MPFISRRFVSVKRRKKRLYQLILTSILIWYFIWDEILQLFVTDQKIPLLYPAINSRLPQNTISRNSHLGAVFKGNIWVILETERSPSTSEKTFCDNSGYTVLVIGNDLYRTQWGKAKCRFHGLTDQKKLNFKSAMYLKNSNVSSTVRKNIGILFAIQQGATVIYDLKTISDFVNIDFNHKWCLRYSGPENFNPFLHFKIVNAGDRRDNFIYYLTDCKQSVISILPSINLTDDTSFPVNKQEYVNEAAPSISVSHDIFLKFVPESQIYHSDSFWNSVLFPKTTVAAALFTSYWKQYLLQQVGEDLSVIAQGNTKYRNYNFNSTPYSIYQQIFHSHTCNGYISIPQCAIKLAKLLVRYKIWEPSNLGLLLAWFDDLNRLNYTLPVLNIKENESPTAVIQYSPKVSLKTQHFTNMCDKQVKIKPTHQKIDDILLLIVFNHPIYKHVGFLHELYSRTFTNIIYCGDNSQQFQSNTQYLDYNLTFIEQSVNMGYQIYKCVSVVMKIDYNVSGILMLSDDVLFNSWNVLDLPTDKPWTGQLYRLRLSERNCWENWRKWFGERAFASAWNEIISHQKHQHAQNKTPQYLTDYLQIENRLNIFGNSTKSVVYGFSDITYFPSTMNNDFIYYADIFAKHKLFHEIAIPVLIGGLTSRDDIFMISGSYLWDKERNYYQNFYNTSHLFFHPFKWSVELNKDEGRQFLCEEYFPYL